MSEIRFDLSGVHVHIGIPVHGQFPPQTTIALVDTCLLLKERGIPFELKIQYGCSIIEQARCYVADNFLNSDCTHLFHIDSDVTWDARDFLTVLALGTKMECVAGAYPVKRDPETWMINANGTYTVNEWGCLPIDGLGLGFCCVQRKVIQQLAVRAPRVRCADRMTQVAVIYRCDSQDGWFRGEDMAFFADVRLLGHEVHLCPQINLGHVGIKEFRGSILEALKPSKLPRDEPAPGPLTVTLAGIG